MKVICAYSGLEFQVQHFPASLSNREAVHPIFHIPQKKLLGYVPTKWAAGELTSTDSYLLFLALLHSTERVEFRLPIFRTPVTDSLIASNMNNLFSVVGRINSVQNPSFAPPEMVITQDTRTLSNVSHWIAAWAEYYSDWNAGYKSLSDEQKLTRRQMALERMINTQQNRNDKAFARVLADWAESAGEFPKSPTLVNGVYLPINEYWKSIIIKCFNAEQIFSIPKDDITELLTHCEDNIIQGNNYAYNLLKALRTGLAKQEDFLGFGDLDLSANTGYQIISGDSSVEDANILAMIQSAPTEKPVESNYPSKLAYLRAKVRWETAQKYKAEQSNSENSEQYPTPTTTISEDI